MYCQLGEVPNSLNVKIRGACKYYILSVTCKEFWQFWFLQKFFFAARAAFFQMEKNVIRLVFVSRLKTCIDMLCHWQSSGSESCYLPRKHWHLNCFASGKTTFEKSCLKVWNWKPLNQKQYCAKVWITFLVKAFQIWKLVFIMVSC